MQRRSDPVIPVDEDDPDYDWRKDQSNYEYEQPCQKCGKAHIIRTQKDNDPEYYTLIYVKCGCGEFVEFELPVN